MNKSEIKLLDIFPIWELWMIHYSPRGINFHGILLYFNNQIYLDVFSDEITSNGKSSLVRRFCFDTAKSKPAGSSRITL